MPIYSDVNQYTPTKQALAEDISSIYQSLGNILSTPTNTRLFLPEFGSNLENLLFELMSPETEASIYDSIIIAIQRWEPRVTIDYAQSSVVPVYEEYKYEVRLTFTINGLSDTNFYTYSGTLFQGGR